MFTNIMHGGSALVVSADIDNLDLASYVEGGQLNITLVINSGITIGSTVNTTACIYSSVATTPSISTIRIVNNGTMKGCNGSGGKGALPGAAATVGGRGCTCIALSAAIILNTSIGTITGGGGGGGGGGPVGQFAGGGAGFPPGAQVFGTGPGTSQYGFAAGGIPDNPSVAGYGGDCNGLGLAGEAGTKSGGKAGGDIGYAINTSGGSIVILGGAANIIGDQV